MGAASLRGVTPSRAMLFTEAALAVDAGASEVRCDARYGLMWKWLDKSDTPEPCLSLREGM